MQKINNILLHVLFLFVMKILYNDMIFNQTSLEIDKKINDIPIPKLLPFNHLVVDTKQKRNQ